MSALVAEGSCPPNFYVDTMASDKVAGRRRYGEELNGLSERVNDPLSALS